MGVKGLWTLLNPVARPIKIETLEGKKLAIDSSIWLYQFQATMKDKEGRTLVNAHVLGFLRRINKLLFHGIKPVFVFDGGAPALKRSTINERKLRKAGNAVNHAQTAEKILNLQLRQAALKQAQAKRNLRRSNSGRSAASDDEGQGMDENVVDENDTGDLITDDMVFLDDLSAPPMTHRAPSSTTNSLTNGQTNADAGPSRSRSQSGSFANLASRSLSPAKRASNTEPAPPGKKNFVRHDPYELPELANKSMHPSAASGGKADERLATEEELRDFIDEMKASDLDVSSAEFRALPPGVQWEITNDLRLRSRAPNYRRTALMVQSSATALDFSKAQIAGLKVRNNLTQRMWGLAGVEGGLVAEGGRIAGEKGREYCLIKNEKEGGWSLGVRDEGTVEKPIDLVPDEDDGSDDGRGGEGRPRKKRRMVRGGVLVEELSGDDSEEEFHRPEPPKLIDPEWVQQKRKAALDALAARYSPVKKPTKPTHRPQPFAPPRAADAPPLFEIESSSAEGSEDDVDMAEVRLAEDEDANLQRALELSARDVGPNSAPLEAASLDVEIDEELDEDMAAALALSRQQVAASARSAALVPEPAPLAAPAPVAAVEVVSSSDDESSADEMEEIHLPTPPRPVPAPAAQPDVPRSPLASAPRAREVIALNSDDDDADDDMEEVAPVPVLIGGALIATSLPEHPLASATAPHPVAAPTPISRLPSASATLVRPAAHTAPFSGSSAAEPSPSNALRSSAAEPAAHLDPLSSRPAAVGSRPVAPAFNGPAVASTSAPAALAAAPAASPSAVSNHSSPSPPAAPDVSLPVGDHLSAPPPEPAPIVEQPELPPVSGAQLTQEARTLQRRSSPPRPPSPPPPAAAPDVPPDDEEIDWSPSPPPMRAYRSEDEQQPPSDIEVDDETGDEGAVDQGADQDDYARFLAQVKGKDLQQVQDDLSAELKTLNNQRKKQTGEGDENITQQMVAQVQMLLQSFGIPYVTAPMEAEAQCAELANLRLVDGIITDDSDVFLFGGTRCYKNLFNDSKYVECYLTSDIQRELSLSRDRLVSMAYLLGSDYAAGITGVGYVTAMEIMAEFPAEGDQGLVDFRQWWVKVQSGKDTEADTDTKWKKAFKKKNKSSLHLDGSFPNPLVRPAYFKPEVDSSKEPFTWGFPDLERLRRLLAGELGWSISKVDDEVLPIVHRIARRSKGMFAGTTQQGSLDSFFDTSGGGTAVFAPKVRQANPSKRLQAVVQRFRESVAALAGEAAPAKPQFFPADDEDGSHSASTSDSDVAVVKPARTVKGKGKAHVVRGGAARGGRGARGAARGRGRGRGGGTSAGTSQSGDVVSDGAGSAPLPPATRKRAPAKKKKVRSPTPESESESSSDGDDALPPARDPTLFDGIHRDAAAPAPKRPRPKPKARTTRRLSTPPSDDDSGDDYQG